jgi:ubiquinone biosynthesis protein Coq4
MDIAVFSTQELPLVVRSLITVAANPEALTLQEQQFLQVIATLHQNSNYSIAELTTETPITPAQVAQVITQPHHRKRLLQMAIVMAMVDGETALHQQKALRSLASALSVNEQGLRVLQEAATGHQLLARFDMFRRIMKKLVVPALQDEGIMGVKKIIEALFFKRGEEPAIAEKYHQLGQLPKGTLGYAFWQHYTQNHFPFPGEAGGIPERLVFHDLGHLLAGYDTTPAGEIQQGAFQAGFIREDGFAFLLFVILQFHWGIKITPVADPSEGLFDIPLVIHALQRGAACKVDLSDHWNFWEVVDLLLEEVRDRYGIPPFHPSLLSITQEKVCA